MLELLSVTKRYGTMTVLDKVSLSLDVNKTHVLLGSSGSGKSTLLRAILALISCDHGGVQIGGVPVTKMSALERAQNMGYVPQDAGLFPHLTAEANVSLVARSLGWEARKIKERLIELIPIIHLDERLLKRFPSELSGGQRQRMALLRALFLDPQIILMDEPFASLDPLIRAEIQEEVKSLFFSLKKTVVFVTHDVGEANYLADNIVLMHAGKVVQVGQLEDLVKRPAEPFVTKFLQAQRVFQVAGGKL